MLVQGTLLLACSSTKKWNSNPVLHNLTLKNYKFLTQKVEFKKRKKKLKSFRETKIYKHISTLSNTKELL